MMVEPVEPWNQSTEAKAGVFVVNLAGVGPISAVFISIGVVLLVRRRGTPRKRSVGMPESPLPHQDPTEAVPLCDPERLEGTGPRALKAYVGAEQASQSATEVFMKSAMTFREFSQKTTPELNDAGRAFAELACVAERALYSTDVPELHEAAREESSASSMRKLLNL